MPHAKIELTERNVRLAQKAEQLLGPGQASHDIRDLGTLALETLCNLLEFRERYGHYGPIELVVHDDRRRHYSHHTPLQDILRLT